MTDTTKSTPAAPADQTYHPDAVAEGSCAPTAEAIGRTAPLVLLTWQAEP
jgi:hypothetical protein